VKNRVTLHGIAAQLGPADLERLVRAAAQVIAGGEDRDCLSEAQLDAADRAYELLVAEQEHEPAPLDLSDARTDQGRYRLFRDHADTYGVQVTWTDLYARFRSGELRMPEETLLAILGAYLEGWRRYDPAAARGRWELVAGHVDDLRDGDVFSVDDGITWQVAYQFMIDVVSVYHGAGREDDATFARVPATTRQPCLVACLTHPTATASLNTP
jgi:hypothetical protein